MPTATPSTTPSAAEFESKISLVAGHLMRSMAAVLDAVPRGTPGPQALARELRIDKVLASRVLKAVRAEDPISVAYHMPGPDPLRRLVRNAAKRGVAPAPIAGALDAIDQFETLIREQAGDRSLLDSLLSAWVPEAKREFELRRKQSAFKAVSQLRGVQADAIVATVLLSPTADGERIDVVWINGLTGVHRVRPGASVRLATRRVSTPLPDGTARRPSTLDGRPVDDPDTLLLREFSSDPTPCLHVRRVGDVVHYTLADDGFGAKSAVDLFFVEVNRSELSRFIPAGTQRKGYFFAEVATPAAQLHFDVLVHQDLYPGQSPTLLIYDTAFEGVANVNDPVRDIDRMDLAETIEPLGLGPSRFRSPDVPRYAELVRHVMDRTNFDAPNFRGFRCRVDYPLYGTQVVMAFDAVPK